MRGPSRLHGIPAAIRCSFWRRWLRCLRRMPLRCGDGRIVAGAGDGGQLIERRLNQLSPAALRLARLAALAGQDFSVELAAHVLAIASARSRRGLA